MTRKRGTERPERNTGPPCYSESCKNSLLRGCQSIDENTRKEVHSYFWEKLNWDQKKSI